MFDEIYKSVSQATAEIVPKAPPFWNSFFSFSPKLGHVIGSPPSTVPLVAWEKLQGDEEEQK